MHLQFILTLITEDILLLPFFSILDEHQARATTQIDSSSGQNLEELKEGTAEAIGEPDTMLNLRKTFAGIFGDMRS